MPRTTHVATTRPRDRDNVSTWALKHTFALFLRTGDPAATPDRCFESKHLKDLRFLVFTALFALLLVFALAAGLSYENESNEIKKIEIGTSNGTPDSATKDASESTKQQTLQRARHHRPFAALSGILTIFGPAVVVFGAIAAWAYQVAGARLGVVDLFACEISTLCRVSTILDTVPHLIGELEPMDRQAPGSPEGAAGGGAPPPKDAAGGGAPPPAPEGQFKSEENYFPVFDSCVKDLQSLEARVVINITAFYTYMKGVRDSMRSPAIRAADPVRRHEATRNLIYLLYLGFESARKAIDDLVEFDPEWAERTIVVLISEFAAYRFLRGEFADEDEMRCKRLKLREPEYDRLMPQLRKDVEAGWKSDRRAWDPAFLLLPELDKRYQEAIDAGKRGTPS